MKFKAPTRDGEVHIALKTGHTCVIPALKDAPDGVDIDPMFHADAIKRGAEPVGVPIITPNPGSHPTRTDVIRGSLQQMLDGDEEGDFKQDGTPDANAVSRRCGFSVKREEVEKIWAELKPAEA